MHSYETLLKRFTEESKHILGENLVGVYLHGSAAMGAGYDPGSPAIYIYDDWFVYRYA